MIIRELDFLVVFDDIQDRDVNGGVWAKASSYAYAGKGEGAASGNASALSDGTTSTSTYASVADYGRVIDAYGSAYGYANQGNSTSRAYSNSLALSIR